MVNSLRADSFRDARNAKVLIGGELGMSRDAHVPFDLPDRLRGPRDEDVETELHVCNGGQGLIWVMSLQVRTWASRHAINWLWRRDIVTPRIRRAFLIFFFLYEPSFVALLSVFGASFHDSLSGSHITLLKQIIRGLRVKINAFIAKTKLCFTLNIGVTSNNLPQLLFFVGFCLFFYSIWTESMV